MGFRDLRASLAQFNLQPVDPEEERQASIERFLSESFKMTGLEEVEMAVNFSESPEEYTVVYDKFNIHRR